MDYVAWIQADSRQILTFDNGLFVWLRGESSGSVMSFLLGVMFVMTIFGDVISNARLNIFFFFILWQKWIFVVVVGGCGRVTWN